MHSQDLLTSISSSLSEQLRHKTNALLSRIVRTNSKTQFAHSASELAEFRDATAGLHMDDDTLSDSFRKTVHFTTYNSYAPLIAKFLEDPCEVSAVIDLLAPGLPDYLAMSSSTSGGIPKYFPKYNRWPKTSSVDDDSWTISDPSRKRTASLISYSRCEPLDLMDGPRSDRPVKTVYKAFMSGIIRRTQFNLHPEKDTERMAMFILDHAAPFATGFIRKYRSFLLIHALFALGSRSLETMTIPYTSTFVDMMRLLDAEFDVIVDCIASGTIPELEGLATVRHYLEVNIFPDPERAAELRSLGHPCSLPGWCGYVWPNMHSITTTASGSFATYTPLAQWFLGPNVDMHARGFGSTEVRIAEPYKPRELNQYKLTSKDIIEFLDVSQLDSISALAQPWELELGKQYEIVLTTQDGLWRYRIGDVIELAGFDPIDGVPIIQYIERRNVALRFSTVMVSEGELSVAIMAMSSDAQIFGWTTMVDHRRSPATIGFFVELVGEQGRVPYLAHATQRVQDELSRSSKKMTSALESGSFRKPTIRLIPSGTFSDFLQMKLDEIGSNNFAQVKIPAVLSKAEHITWFLNRVVREL